MCVTKLVSIVIALPHQSQPPFLFNESIKLLKNKKNVINLTFIQIHLE